MGLGVTGPFGTTGTHQFDWCHVFSCQSFVPAGAGTPRFENRVLTGGGVCGSFATHTPTLDSGLRRNDELGGRNDECEGITTDAGMTRPTVVAGTIHPGSESGTCFRANRSCRLVPARQGVKSRSCGLVQRIGTVDSATPHPDPSGGQAPALHLLVPPSTIGLQFGTFRRWRAGIEVDWRAHPGSESGTCFRAIHWCRHTEV